MTEKRNPASVGIDERSVSEILEIINKEDEKIPEAVAEELDHIEEAVKLVISTVKAGGRIFFIGSGTSGRMGVLEAAELPPTFGVPPEMFQALIAGGKEAVFRSIEAAEDSEEEGLKIIKESGVTAKDLVIGVTATGSTPFVLGAIKNAAGIGARTVGVSCNPEALLSRHVSVPIEVLAGPEVVAGSTRMKAGTAQKMVLNMITTTAMVKLGSVYDGYMVGVKPWNGKLRKRSVRIVKEVTDVNEEEAEKLLNESGWDVRVALLTGLTDMSPEEAVEELDKNKTIRGILKNRGKRT